MRLFQHIVYASVGCITVPKSFLLFSSFMLPLTSLIAVNASCSVLKSGWHWGVEFSSSHSNKGYFITRWIGLIIRDPMSSRFGFPLIGQNEDMTYTQLHRARLKIKMIDTKQETHLLFFTIFALLNICSW